MLQLQNISKTYTTGELVQQALKGVSFNLRDNEFVSILGHSGSGKTTLLNIIGGLDRSDEGELIINGISTKNYKNKDWDTYRNHTIGFVFQSYNLIPHQSILSNVELALTISGISVKERKKRAKEALVRVGLGDHIHKKPNQLSGGQMQRVAIARALVNDPAVLLADEPTGALDSDTSVQIMELLKEVAGDRLVVMVTHNAELAEAYSTRIITLRDGQIQSDSDPYEPKVEEVTAAGAGKAVPDRHARMSFWTSLSLSFNNLRSKMGRTILISLACSIGIIGIALILSISSGVNNYIYDIQRDTMSSYPLTISAQTIDLNGLMEQGQEMRSEMMEVYTSTGEDDGNVHTDYTNMQASNTVSTGLVVNNLTEFKKYLDDPENEINQYLGENGIVYTYDVAFDVYTYNSEGVLQNTDASVSDIVGSGNEFASMMSQSLSYMRSSFSTWQSGAYSSASNFSEMASGGSGNSVSQVIKDGYEVLSGEWPEEYNEVVLVLNKNGSLDAETLYQLGIMTGDEYLAASQAIEEGEELEDITWSYDDILGRTFYLVTASDHYVANEDGTFSYLDDSVMNQETLLENAVELTITGIVRVSEDSPSMSISTAIGYTSKLTEYCIEHTKESAVVQAQEAAPDVNVLTGLKFEADSDEEKAAQAVEYIQSLGAEEKAQLYTMIMYYEANDEAGVSELNDSMDLSSMMELFGLSDDSNMTDMMTILQSLGGSYMESLMSNVGSLITDEAQQSALLDRWLEEDPDQEILVAIYDQYLKNGSYADNMSAFGLVSEDAPTSINIYTDTFEAKDQITALIDAYNQTVDSDYQIVYTDYIALLTTSMTSIVNAITYVLIAFVAISLIVSCIMIGIITHISVLERTKEIGILRAMGASRRNISQVFNAETVIIGLIAGLFGVLISALLTVPINLILAALLGADMISVGLPISAAIILILISVLVTVIGGLLPASKASKKDPVIALRTE